MNTAVYSIKFGINLHISKYILYSNPLKLPQDDHQSKAHKAPQRDSACIWSKKKGNQWSPFQFKVDQVN